VRDKMHVVYIESLGCKGLLYMIFFLIWLGFNLQVNYSYCTEIVFFPSILHGILSGLKPMSAVYDIIRQALET
jgi:hypothetical protein